MNHAYRVEHRVPDGTVAELTVMPCRSSAVATAASWADWLRRKECVGEVAAIDRHTDEAIRIFPVSPLPASLPVERQ